MHGIEWKQEKSSTMTLYLSQGTQGSSTSSTINALYAENQELQLKVCQLEAKVQELEQCSTRVLADDVIKAWKAQLLVVQIHTSILKNILLLE